MPDKLKELFEATDAALFELHREMERVMEDLPGCELWREVCQMRARLNSEIRPMTENNFKS